MNSNKKNVGLFVGKLAGGGAERVVSRLSVALAKKYNIYVLIYNSHVQHYKAEGTVIDIGEGAKKFPIMALNAAKNINKVVKENNLDILISFLDMPNLINGIINYSCKKVVSIRAYYELGKLYTINDKIKFPFMKYAFRRADSIFVLSQKQKEIVIRDMNINEEQIYVVDNLFFINEINNAAREEVLDEWMKEEDITIAIGRLNFQKNYEVLLELFAKLVKKKPTAKLVILGGGELEYKLKEMSIQYGIQNSVKFLGRVLNPYPYIKAAKLYISVSNFEGFPNSLVESMICGVPVIHTDCMTGPGEILREKYCSELASDVEYADYGVLIPVLEKFQNIKMRTDDDNKLLDKIIDVWKDMLEKEDLRKDYALKAKERGKKYRAEIIVEKYCEIIDKLLEE